jgi:CBS domain-containing protein
MAERVFDIMSRAAVVVDAASSASDARALADERKVHHVLVIDGEIIVGVLSRCDLDWAFDTDPVTRCMKVPVALIQPDNGLELAVELLRSQRVGCLPVVDILGRLLGVVTRGDLRRAGTLAGERGIDCCASCGASHCLFSADGPDTPAFCCGCLDHVRERGVRELYFTLGGGD